MSKNILKNFNLCNQLPLDSRYYNGKVPYSSTDEVLEKLLPYQRYKGLKVNVDGTEYWFKDGIEDSDLIKIELDQEYYAFRMIPYLYRVGTNAVVNFYIDCLTGQSGFTYKLYNHNPVSFQLIYETTRTYNLFVSGSFAIHTFKIELYKDNKLINAFIVGDNDIYENQFYVPVFNFSGTINDTDSGQELSQKFNNISRELIDRSNNEPFYVMLIKDELSNIKIYESSTNEYLGNFIDLHPELINISDQAINDFKDSLISDEYNKNLISQDSIYGIYKITNTEIFINNKVYFK